MPGVGAEGNRKPLKGSVLSRERQNWMYIEPSEKIFMQMRNSLKIAGILIGSERIL